MRPTANNNQMAFDRVVGVSACGLAPRSCRMLPLATWGRAQNKRGRDERTIDRAESAIREYEAWQGSSKKGCSGN